MGIAYTPITFILQLRGEKRGMLAQPSLRERSSTDCHVSLHEIYTLSGRDNQ